MNIKNDLFELELEFCLTKMLIWKHMMKMIPFGI